jgi:NADH:ubiquinone oxidoreductase subunit 5 (subunit L)/multisubunit Na+/H+ antiporter MnhA subunit
MTVIAAGLTSFYSWRLIFKTFHGEPHDQHHYEAAHEAPMWMLVPIGILAAGSSWPVSRSRKCSRAMAWKSSSASR